MTLNSLILTLFSFCSFFTQEVNVVPSSFDGVSQSVDVLAEDDKGSTLSWNICGVVTSSTCSGVYNYTITDANGNFVTNGSGSGSSINLSTAGLSACCQYTILVSYPGCGSDSLTFLTDGCKGRYQC